MGSRVYIGRLAYDCRERDIERFFKGYGKIKEVLLKNGFGFVDFDDYRDADDAVYELNGKELLGERVILELARGPSRGARRYGYRRRGSWLDKSRYGPPTRTEYRLIVENLSTRVSWQDLKDFMRQAGEVTYADAHKRRRNEGVVEFTSYSDMKNAITKLDNTEFNGRRIKLIEERSYRNRRSRSRSSSRSRSRSYSRSRSRRRHSKSRSKSASRSKSRSKSRSPKKILKSKSKSHSKSPSPARRSRSKEKSVSKSPRQSSMSPERAKSKSRSPVPSDKSPETSPRSDKDD